MQMLPKSMHIQSRLKLSQAHHLHAAITGFRQEMGTATTAMLDLLLDSLAFARGPKTGFDQQPCTGQAGSLLLLLTP